MKKLRHAKLVHNGNKTYIINYPLSQKVHSFMYAEISDHDNSIRAVIKREMFREIEHGT
jgi:hypothetical protein